MEKYINKAAILAEIERIYNEDYKFLPSDLVESVQDFKDDLLLALNTIEVKVVDLDKEIKHFIMSKELYEADSVIKAVAEHFFELGLKARKGDALNDTISFINTLEVNKVNSEFLKKYFEETPQEELDKEWKEIEPLNDIGPDVLEYANKKE